MEDFWGILKRERYYGRRFAYSNSLVQMIEEHIDYYNSKRLQRNLGVLTPMEKHQQFYLAAKKNRWQPSLPAVDTPTAKAMGFLHR